MALGLLAGALVAIAKGVGAGRDMKATFDASDRAKANGDKYFINGKGQKILLSNHHRCTTWTYRENGTINRDHYVRAFFPETEEGDVYLYDEVDKKPVANLTADWRAKEPKKEIVKEEPKPELLYDKYIKIKDNEYKDIRTGEILYKSHFYNDGDSNTIFIDKHGHMINPDCNRYNYYQETYNKLIDVGRIKPTHNFIYASDISKINKEYNKEINQL